MGDWGRAPSKGTVAELPVGVGGGSWAKPPAADEVFVFKTVIFNASATVFTK